MWIADLYQKIGGDSDIVTHTGTVEGVSEAEVTKKAEDAREAGECDGYFFPHENIPWGEKFAHIRDIEKRLKEAVQRKGNGKKWFEKFEGEISSLYEDLGGYDQEDSEVGELLTDAISFWECFLLGVERTEF